MMDREPGTGDLGRQAAEMILGASSLTDELTDEEARPLIAWALSQGEAAAGVLSASGEPASLPSRDAHELLATEMAPVRRLMRAINVLAAERRGLSPGQIFDELEALRSAAQQLPAPPVEVATDTALAELAAWQARLDTRAFVGAVVYLLRTMPDAETS